VIRHRREESPKSKIAAGHFFDISGIGISAFPLIRSRALHIRSSQIVKREEVAEERFGISTFQDPGSRGDSDWNREHHELPVREIAPAVGSREEPQPLISLEVG
jgi:hypothetical protein